MSRNRHVASAAVRWEPCPKRAHPRVRSRRSVSTPVASPTEPNLLSHSETATTTPVCPRPHSRAHNPKVPGSSPAPQPVVRSPRQHSLAGASCFWGASRSVALIAGGGRDCLPLARPKAMSAVRFAPRATAGPHDRVAGRPAAPGHGSRADCPRSRTAEVRDTLACRPELRCGADEPPHRSTRCTRLTEVSSRSSASP